MVERMEGVSHGIRRMRRNKHLSIEARGGVNGSGVFVREMSVRGVKGSGVFVREMSFHPHLGSGREERAGSPQVVSTGGLSLVPRDSTPATHRLFIDCL